MIIETLRSQLEASNMTIRQMSSTIDNLQQTISDLRKTIANLESLLKERVIKEKLTKWDFGSGGENPYIDLTILFGQLVLCLLSDVGMSFHPVKRWFSRTEVSSLEAKTPLGRALQLQCFGSENTALTCNIPQAYCRPAELPQIHFGRADGVERTLCGIACQGETFSAPPWQGGIDIRFLWHIGCQSEFDEVW